MKWGVIMLVVWTAVVGFFLIQVVTKLTEKHVYAGGDIQFSTTDSIQIEADSVIMEAVSSEGFVLQNENGEKIAGQSNEPPLGWPDEKYYTFGPERIDGGRWTWTSGVAAIRISSENTVTVKTIPPDPTVVWILWTAIAFVAWMVGIAMYLTW